MSTEEILLKHKETINRIVTSKACSRIDKELLDAVTDINKRNGKSICTHCPSSLYRAFVFAKNILDNYGERTETKETKDRKETKDGTKRVKTNSKKAKSE